MFARQLEKGEKVANIGVHALIGNHPDEMKRGPFTFHRMGACGQEMGFLEKAQITNRSIDFLKRLINEASGADCEVPDFRPSLCAGWDSNRLAGCFEKCPRIFFFEIGKRRRSREPYGVTGIWLAFTKAIENDEENGGQMGRL